MRSPVYKVQGRAIKERVMTKNRTYYYITVRKIKFSDLDYIEMVDFFDAIKDKDEIAVEYSPRTKHVWRMYETEDLK